MLETDRRRLRAWRTWLQAARRRPGLVQAATPVCGAWQLTFRVHNFAPAVQRVVLEQQDSDGRWSELAGRHTIEFRAFAARPRARLVREFSAPVASPASVLRLVVRGVGQVGISHATLTNGITTFRQADWARRRILGRRAPTSGFPPLPATADDTGLRLSFPANKMGRTRRSAP